MSVHRHRESSRNSSASLPVSSLHLETQFYAARNDRTRYVSRTVIISNRTPQSRAHRSVHRCVSKNGEEKLVDQRRARWGGWRKTERRGCLERKKSKEKERWLSSEPEATAQEDPRHLPSIRFILPRRFRIFPARGARSGG